MSCVVLFVFVFNMPTSAAYLVNTTEKTTCMRDSREILEYISNLYYIFFLVPNLV